jgi:hypothetical protein
MTRITHQLAAPLDDAVEGETGLRPSRLLQMQAVIVSLVEDRYNDTMRRLGPVFGAGTLPDAVGAYYREFPEMVGEEDALVALLEHQAADLDQTKTLLLLHRGPS